MRIFQCGFCNHPLYFENVQCENCGHLCGYRDINHTMLTFNPAYIKLVSDVDGKAYKYCKNKTYEICNWLIDEQDEFEFCSACQLNRTIPNLAEAENFDKWKNLEIAKHRLVYQLHKIGLELPSKLIKNQGLCFDFVANQNNSNLMTGHLNGVITILLNEADSVLREQMRKQLREPYRTLIGHLRHEVGHYFWDQLIYTDENTLNNFRQVFGDERTNYSAALQSYYTNGAPANWQQFFISKYAASHPWEDWAETWAHYLHVMDMVETAYFFNLQVAPTNMPLNMNTTATFDPYIKQNFDEVINTCVPLSFALNSINRAMGIPDVYLFVISPAVIEKMRFIHQLLLPKRKLS